MGRDSWPIRQPVSQQVGLGGWVKLLANRLANCSIFPFDLQIRGFLGPFTKCPQKNFAKHNSVVYSLPKNDLYLRVKAYYNRTIIYSYVPGLFSYIMSYK